MSELLCKLHGMQSASFTSPRISERVARLEKLNDLPIVKLTLFLPFEKKGIFWVDSSFVAGLDMKPEGSSEGYEVKNEERAFEIYSELRAVCSKCLNDSI